MSFLYVIEQGATISIDSNYVKVKYRDDMDRKIPIESLESISIFGRAQMTTQCTVECLKRGIPVSYYSRNGSYFGCLESTGHIQVERQRRQAELYHSDFSLELARRILRAKIKNQEVVLQRYAKNRDANISEELKMMNISYQKLESGKHIDQMMGYEGTAARYYFQGLGKLVDAEFYFCGRSRRPPKDEFNAMLSLGYSILLNEIYGKIQNKGLNPYFGFIHQDREKHPTLASDLMEEWRAVIVDSVVMSLVNGHEIHKEHFQQDENGHGYYLTNEGLKLFINKMEKKIHTDIKYLGYVDYPVSFRRAMELQIMQLIKAMNDEDASLYEPIRIR